MALTDVFVSNTGANAHDGTSEANAYSVVELAALAAPAGLRGNFKKSVPLVLGSQLAMTAPGTTSQPVIFRGYTTNIGDADLGWTAGGGIITTNMPTIDTSTFDIAVGQANWIFQDIDITGANVGGPVITLGLGNLMTNCRVVNSGNNALARGISSVNNANIFNCDIETTGATSGICVVSLRDGSLVGCRIKSKTSQGASSNQSGAAYIGNTFYECGDDAIFIAAVDQYVHFNTIVNNIGSAVKIAAHSHISIYGNMITGNAVPIERSSALPAYYAYNRTRDNTGAAINLGDWPELNFITTDTGGDETDYNDAAAGDFRLVSGSPGDGAGPQGQNIGALATMAASGGGGAFGMMGMVG